MKRLIQVLLIVLAIQVQAQHDSIPSIVLNKKFVQTNAGETVKIVVGRTLATATLKMSQAPESARLIDSLFVWDVPEQFVGQNVVVEFSLIDNNLLLDKKSLFISVATETNPPILRIESNAQDDRGIYHVTPHKKFILSITAESQVSKKKDKVVLDYFFNEEKNLKSLDSAKVKINQNTISLEWTPQRSQLDNKYFSFTVLATDDHHQVNEKNILLILTRQNQPPYFIYPVMDEYYISANEKLEIDLAARDPEGDSLLYQLNIPSTIGNPQLSGGGKFTWTLNPDQIMRLRKEFPIEVAVEATEIKPDNPHTIVKRFTIHKSVKNQPPKILNLQNESIQEGLEYHKTVYIQDGNDESNDLEIEIRGAPKGMRWTFHDNMLDIKWTPDFDVVGVEMKPETFDMLLIVKDPYGYLDQKAFTLTVHHREDTDLTYQAYLEYRDDAVQMVEVLSQINSEMQTQEYKVQNIKKGLSVSSMVFATYTAIGNVYEEESLAKKMIPYVGGLAVIAGGINAFGFNDLPKYTDLREKSYVLHQKMRYILNTLAEYRIDGPNSPNLENAEFRDQLRSFKQMMINDKLDFKRYYAKYLSLNYVKKQIKQEAQLAKRLGREPRGILFLDMDDF